MKITLLCALGMSTSLLVERMKTAAEKHNIRVEIEAHAVDDIDKQLETADIILLGPQIRYKKNELYKKAEASSTPIDIIDMKAYGATDGEKVLDQALNLKK
ncbi:PTS system, cellobiose-specific IIB component [Lentibacillus halodurans]|uniref:PTS system, cellobiose-specific IIB component n=1 Tax=Lentibacillus halodurans TaxID=237679 RepID=A0A1I1AMV0_9BACI|nr:PTS sugar transporter subunit IIB [Lentibacillus halodurans]SFB39277.1 PTS system, cellobiose-specific IIB component [Lentibacillus halodurans]